MTIIDEINRISREQQNIPSTDILIPTGFIWWDYFKTTKIVYLLRDYYRELISTLEYETCIVEDCEVVSVEETRKLGLANPGRERGDDPEIYDLCKKNHKFGWDLTKLPPFTFKGSDNPINGNHRFKYYEEIDLGFVPSYRVTPKPGFTENDVINELGLKYQERPSGAPSKFQDYRSRGILWVIEQNSIREDRVTEEDVRGWVSNIAEFETPDTQNRLVDSIYNATEKKSFLAFFSRKDCFKFFKEKGVKLSASANIKGSHVNRLISAMGPVHVYRDFFPFFVEDAAKGITSTVHFYVNTNKCEDAFGVLNLIALRIKEIESHIDNLGNLLGQDAAVTLRKHLRYGYRPPHIVDLDNQQLVPVNGKVEFDTAVNTEREYKWQQTERILRDYFEVGQEFTYQEARQFIHPIRTQDTKFKSEDSFDGTILREFQFLAEKGVLRFHADERRPGIYSLL